MRRIHRLYTVGFAGISAIFLSFFSVSTVLAAGETYSMSSNGGTLTVKGGNVKYADGKTSLVLGKNDGMDFGEPGGDTAAYGVSFTAKDGTCDYTSSAYLEIFVNTSTKKIISVSSGCGTLEEPDTQESYADATTWATNVSYSVQSNSSGGTPDTSGTPTYKFIGANGQKIEACGGIFNYFDSKCVTLSFNQAPNQSKLAGVAENEFFFLGTGTTTFTSKPCSVDFVIGIPKRPNIKDSSLDAHISRQISKGDGCDKVNIPESKIKMSPPGTEIKVTNADGFKSFFIDSQHPAEEENASVCSMGGPGLSWIICPVMDTIALVNDGAFAMVKRMLFINPVTVNVGGPLYNTWTKFRDLANILFILAFLIVVFSQATSYGLSSYGIKKLLPRIIAAAILVNLSFFICQIALDASNILGVSIGNFVDSYRSPKNLDVNVISWSSVVAVIGVGAATVAGVSVIMGAYGVAAAFALLLPIAVTALFAIVTAIVVLVARQALIVILIAISPLAFVAFILPNTQKYFQLWQNSFTTMMVMFPLVAALFAFSELAANIILTSDTSPDGVSILTVLVALGVMFIPLFGVPILVKYSGGLLGRVAGMVNNPNKGPFDALRKRAEGYSGRLKNEAAARNLDHEGRSRNPFVMRARRDARRSYLASEAERRAKEASTGYIGRELSPGGDAEFTRRAAGAGRFFNREVSEDALNRAMSTGVQAMDEIDAKNLKAAQVLLQNAKMDGDGLKTLVENAPGAVARGLNGQEVKGSSTMQMAAASLMMQQGREMDTVVEKLASSSDSKVREFAVGQIQSNFQNAKDRQVGLTDEGFMKKVIAGDVRNTTDFNRELTLSTGKKAADLPAQKLVTQEKTSALKIESYVTSNPGNVYTAKIKEVATLAWGNNGQNTTMAQANDDTKRVIENIKR